MCYPPARHPAACHAQILAKSSPLCCFFATVCSEQRSARDFQTVEQMASFIENLTDYSHQQASQI